MPMKPNLITYSLLKHHRDDGIADIKVSDNDNSVILSINFNANDVNIVKWLEGHKIGDQYQSIHNGNTKKAPPSTSTWELADQWLGALTSPHKMRLFAKASISKFIEGPVSLPVLDHRHQCCHGVNLAGEKVSEPCKARYETDRGVFCKTCGCPEYSMADISVNHHKPTKSKLAFPALECPMNKFSAVSGRRREARNAH